MASIFAAGLAASPVKSEVFAAFALLILSFAALLILRYYLPLRTTPAYLLVPVFFAIWLPASIVLLVPIDLASNAQTDDEATRGVWLPRAVLGVSWRITYWLTFCLTWFILPVLAEYSDAGYREPRDRLLYSLRSNAQYHIMVFGSAIVGIAYVIVAYGFHVDAIKSTVMALAYCWGLILAIYLMGHGLVAIPRRLIRTATPARRLRRLQTLAPGVYEKLEESEMTLEEVELQVVELGRRKTGSALEYAEWIEELNEGSSLGDIPTRLSRAARAAGAAGAAGAAEAAEAASSGTATTRTVPVVVTKKYIADLTRRLVRARHARSRYLSEWNRLLHRYAETQAVLDSAASQRLELAHASATDDLWARQTLLTPYARHVLYFHVVPAARLALGLLLAAASAAIVWSELVKAALPSASVLRFTVIHHWTGDKGQVGFAGQIIATAWILYMCAAALTSVTEVKVWRGRALVKRNTAHESAFWYASQVARLSIPLSYNFMTFLSKSVYEKTVFYDFLGRLINFTDLGKWFDYLLPTFILIPVLATLFGLYGRVRRVLGYGDAGDPEDAYDAGAQVDRYGAALWREGRDLVEREINGTSIRQRRLEAARGGADTRRPVRGAYTDDPEDSLASPTSPSTTPFALSPSSSGILPARTLGGGSRGPASSSAQPPTRRGQATRRDPFADDDDAGDGFFAQIGHRMKNTIDTIDTPKWFTDLGAGLQKPAWLPNNNSSSSNNNAGSSSHGNPPSQDAGIRRWFGGDSRVRL